MYLHLEDATATHYGGWLVGVSHNSNTGPYATNIAEGNTNNPIISGTVIRVYDVEATANWNPTTAIGNRLTAGQWYGGGGYKSPTHRTHWLVYDPRNLATQAANLTGPWSELDFTDAWAVNYDRRRESYVSPAAVPGATAAVFDDVASKLYVVVQGADLGTSYNQYLPLVYVYSVNS
jgi:hypothetical protein